MEDRPHVPLSGDRNLKHCQYKSSSVHFRLTTEGDALLLGGLDNHFSSYCLKRLSIVSSVDEATGCMVLSSMNR